MEHDTIIQYIDEIPQPPISYPLLDMHQYSKIFGFWIVFISVIVSVCKLGYLMQSYFF